jgi:hypothetical protein
LHWVILYIDASFLNNITPFVIEYDPKVYVNAKRRADQIWAADDPLKFQAEGRFDGSCDYCKFRQACGAAILSAWATTKEKFSAADVTAIEPLALDYLTAKELAAATEKVAKTKGQALTDALVSRKINKCKNDKWGVTWYEQKGKTTVDCKAAVAAGLNLMPFERTGNPFDVLRVSRKKDKEPKNDE